MTNEELVVLLGIFVGYPSVFLYWIIRDARRIRKTKNR